jgi:hypothetical protein
MKKPLKISGKKTRLEGVGGGDFEMALDNGSKAKVDDFPPIDGGIARVCSKALQSNEFELEDEPLSLSEEEAALLYSAPATTATHASKTIHLESALRDDAPPRNIPSAGLQMHPNEAARKVSNAIQSNKKQTRANIVVEVRPGVTIPWSKWAGLERDRYNENGPSLNTSERLYEATLTQQGMLGEAQRQYGATRTHFIALVQEEAGLSDAAAIIVRLNKELGIRIVDNVSLNIVARSNIRTGPVVGPDGALLRHGEVLTTNKDTANTVSGRVAGSDRISAICQRHYGVAKINSTCIVLYWNS